MTRFISAAYHADIKVSEFICDDGRHLLRCGGTLPWRINNGGDLSSPVNSQGLPAPKKTKNYIGFASVPSKHSRETYHFFIFPDYETGREQLELSLKRKYAGHTLPQLVEKYAHQADNDTAKYTEDLLMETGIEPSKTVAELSPHELHKLADAIEKLEGYHNDTDSRKEIWVPVSTITASDGARPLADEEIVLRVQGKEVALKSNHVGQFPPVAHPNGPIEVLHKQANGDLKQVGKLSGENGQHFSLLTRVQRFFGMPGPDAAPVAPPPVAGGGSAGLSRKTPLIYTVQPHDTLSGIAEKFKISVEQIKHDNALKHNVIFAGQCLSIFGLAASAAIKHPPTPPKRNAPRREHKSVAHVVSASSAAPPVKKVAPPAHSATEPARSDDGTGKPLALMATEQRRAPWMAIAFREAITFAGKDEAEITKTHNYHRMVTDRDRAGGEVIPLRDKKGNPLLSKDGTARTRKKFDGAPTLVGTSNAWCASFVNYCLREAAYPVGRRPMSTYTFGEDSDLFIRIKQPVYGAIRYSRRVGGGHVCFVYGKLSGKLVVLGGNQDDCISFELRPLIQKGVLFYIPISYLNFAKEESGVDLAEVDIESLRRSYGGAVAISDAEVRRRSVAKGSEV